MVTRINQPFNQPRQDPSPALENMLLLMCSKFSLTILFTLYYWLILNLLSSKSPRIFHMLLGCHVSPIPVLQSFSFIQAHIPIFIFLNFILFFCSLLKFFQLRYKWRITLCKCKVYKCWFDTFIYCHMIVALPNSSIMSHNSHFFCAVKILKV